jgi:hypothetical protein
VLSCRACCGKRVRRSLGAVHVNVPKHQGRIFATEQFSRG